MCRTVEHTMYHCSTVYIVERTVKNGTEDRQEGGSGKQSRYHVERWISVVELVGEIMRKKEEDERRNEEVKIKKSLKTDLPLEKRV